MLTFEQLFQQQHAEPLGGIAGSTDSDVGVMYGEKELWTYSNATKDDEVPHLNTNCQADATIACSIGRNAILR